MTYDIKNSTRLHIRIYVYFIIIIIIIIKLMSYVILKIKNGTVKPLYSMTLTFFNVILNVIPLTILSHF